MAYAVFIRAGSGITGPFTEDQVRELALRGEIGPDTELSLIELSWVKAASRGDLTFAAPAADPDATAAVTEPEQPVELSVDAAATSGKRSLFSRLSQAKDQAATAGDDSLLRYLPGVQEMLMAKLGTSASSVGRDDAALTNALGYVYDALPFPVRMAVKKDKFVAFCLKNRDRLLPEGKGDADPASPGTATGDRPAANP